jgi:hypothetical protein
MTKPNLDGLLLPARAPKEDAPFKKEEIADAQKSSAISFEHLGGKQIWPPVAQPSETPIDFSHIGGKRVDIIQPEKSVGTEDESSE